ncbi:MAG: CPBP family glutamic-type intramembrane protease [Methanomassiliicoccales archaeon]|nr:CPBP family glutamic-type intramembrane protease [Methanomassiliicoccales archaeon]
MEEQAPRSYCSHCGASLPADALFCHRCGQTTQPSGQDVRGQYAYYAPTPVPLKRKSSLQTTREVLRGIGAVMTLIILTLVTVNVGLMIWGAGLVIPKALESTTSLFLALPWLVRILSLPGLSFVIYYVLLIAAVLLSYLFMLGLGRKEFLKELSFKETRHSPAYTISTLFMAILTMNTGYYVLIGLFGVDASSGGSENAALWELLYSLLRASVWEEVICRILYIGLPLAVVYAVKGKAAPYGRYIFGGGFQFGTWEKVFLILSASIFAIAHVFSWDLYKVLPTFVAGLALGYLFLKYGVYASIMLHFFIDYLSMPTYVWPGTGTDLFLGIFLIVAMVVGFVYMVYYFFRALELFSGRSIWRWESKRPVAAYYQASPSAPAYQPYAGPAHSPSFGFVCRHCGGTEASYADGKFRCSRCGKEN